MSKVKYLTKRREKIEVKIYSWSSRITFNFPCHSFIGVLTPFLLVELDDLQPPSFGTITKLNRGGRQEEKKENKTQRKIEN